jgi:hypothetical protein
MPVPATLLCFTSILLIAACGRPAEEAELPPAQVELPAQTPPGVPMHTTVVGCLRAGEAEGTFVLMASDPDLPFDARTYQLGGAMVRQQPDLFRQHAGHTVSVSGTYMVPEEGTQRVRTRAEADDQRDDVAETPIVETETELEIREMDVESIERVAEGCEP